MKFIYVLTVLFFIGCQSQPPMSSAGKIDEIEKTLNQLTDNQQASDDVSMSSAGKIDEIEKTLNQLMDNQQASDGTSMSSVDEMEKLKQLTDDQKVSDSASMSSTNKDKFDEMEKKLKQLTDDQKAGDSASMSSINKLKKQLKELIKKKPDTRLKAYKAAYDGREQYREGYYLENISSIENAIKFFKKALDLQKTDEIYIERQTPIININKGFGFGKNSNDYGKSTASNQLSYYLYLTLGKSYFSLCRMDKDGNENYCEFAIDSFDKAINILKKSGHNYADPYYHKGMTYMLHNNIEEAQKNFKEARKVHNKGKKYFEERIIIEELSSLEYRKYIKNKKYRKNKKNKIKKKIKDELYSSESRIHIALAVAYSRLPVVSQNINNVKLSKNTKKWLKEMKKEYLKVLRIDPEHDDALHNLGETEYSLKNYKNAIKEINKALFINPVDAVSYFAKGSSLLRLGKYDSACFNFSIAEILDERYEARPKKDYEQVKQDAKCL